MDLMVGSELSGVGDGTGAKKFVAFWVNDEFAAAWQKFIIYWGLFSAAICYHAFGWFKAYLSSIPYEPVTTNSV